jgi:hypothetical protein
MWALHLIPTNWLEASINTLIIIGVLGSVMSWLISILPFFAAYRTVISIFSTIVLVIGVFFKGGYAVESDWRSRLDDMEQKLKDAEERASHINTVVETQTIEKIEKVREVMYVNKNIIHEKKAAIDSQCIITDDARMFYNSAIEGQLSGSADDTVGAESNTPAIGSKS